MDYINAIKAAGFGQNPAYPQNDIGIAKLFFDLHSNVICFVPESKTWYAYSGRRWVKENGVYRAIELCKAFTQAFSEYAKQYHADDQDFVRYAGKLTSRRNRDGILADARSIAPVSLNDFDKDKLLLNCLNGTLNLRYFSLQPHNPQDRITKLAFAKYDPDAVCERWDRFIDEIMCGDQDTAVYLQKSMGYACTGLMEYECFFVLYGSSSRNGKTTPTESIGTVLGDYCITAQPQTFARRNSDGSAASPDTARLKGARLINIPEPEKEMSLNSALIKQLTGGDKYAGRFLNENIFEFRMEGKPFINTNHLPRVSDDTVFASGRAKIIPFKKHFTAAEQDKTLKQKFREGKAKSAILNWLVMGYRLITEVGFDSPPSVEQAIAEYREEADVIGLFLAESTCGKENGRLSTALLYSHYAAWAKENGYKAMNNKNFVSEIARRHEIRRDGKVGKVIIGLALVSGSAA
jgi:putative DNA primase/helicase